MSKRRRKGKHRPKRSDQSSALPSTSWLDDDGLHVLSPGASPSPEMLEEMTKVYQEKIRSSPLWDQIVEQVGEEEAERMLQPCRVELR